MRIRPCTARDAAATARLFFEAVHESCAGDYTPAQLDAWAPAARDLTAWGAQLAASHALAAECDGTLAGFATRRPADVLDLLYVSPRFQRRGVASALCDRLEAACAADDFRTMTVHASRTARPFFEQRGYHVLAEQQVERRDVTLTNFRMEKTLDQVR